MKPATSLDVVVTATSMGLHEARQRSFRTRHRGNMLIEMARFFRVVD